jgi:hypothetical protein
VAVDDILCVPPDTQTKATRTPNVHLVNVLKGGMSDDIACTAQHSRVCKLYLLCGMACMYMSE